MTLPPVGPERDRAVAEMLGLKPCGMWKPLYHDVAIHDGPVCEGGCYPQGAPAHYSRNDGAAMNALETWRGQKEGRSFAVFSPVVRDNRYMVRVSGPTTEEGSEYEHGETFPDAATQALLRTGGRDG